MSRFLKLRPREKKQLEEKRKLVFNYYMDNPCLSEEVDYQSEEKRKIYYKTLVNNMDENQLDEIILDYELVDIMGLIG